MGLFFSFCWGRVAYLTPPPKFMYAQNSTLTKIFLNKTNKNWPFQSCRITLKSHSRRLNRSPLKTWCPRRARTPSTCSSSSWCTTPTGGWPPRPLCCTGTFSQSQWPQEWRTCRRRLIRVSLQSFWLLHYTKIVMTRHKNNLILG